MAAELARLQQEKSSLLEAARERIASSSTDSSPEPSNTERLPSLLELPNITLKDLFAKETEEEKARKNTSSKKVNEEIEKLKKALGERKVLKDLPKEVEQAREGVITCLRLNDRQSLDCWKEVEIFKREVRKLEEQFVGRVL